MQGFFALGSAALATLLLAAVPAAAVTVTETTAAGLAVYRYSWTDSKGRPRNVSLKKEGSGNPGHGGYAVAASYQYLDGGVWKTKAVKPSDVNDGFGYFVSHERERLFTDGERATIARKIFHVDDSPLGKNFAVATATYAPASNLKIIRFSLVYPHYGTIAANGIDLETGDDAPPLGASSALFVKYSLPVRIWWYFKDGADYPRIRTQVSLASLPGPDRVSFDLRGPYGKLDFDGGANSITQVRWGDDFHFVSTTMPLTRNSAWTWNVINHDNRYTSLIAGGFEMGLVNLGGTKLNDGYADGRGRTSSVYFNGKGCPYEPQLIPCDYEWPYQSAQYELPYDNRNGVTTSEKIAWGSTPFFGTSLTSTYDGRASHPFDGFPANKAITYDLCLVLGRTIDGGTTRAAARDVRLGNGHCAATAP
ncbi:MULTISPECIES: hypothetical protein [Methylosinus]|uniref:Secreted protein n=1 Tax=Methylosinus trichosporium (strain ATCC 35070 / NCIMB 11131 / UNIQEM 75 / OB3b) TaxID=595536 RepID=A0A2D2CZM5_METT3|nr:MULTISPECIES: hypothetical protein [Methylosinus]ATQ68172.1 hypothetical protein CQW49_10005 [Methylosinus trichosporium OB3b]OBS53437.1 hypothetical protein A8B73_05820 [Methylosinus sp. 3S-1]